MMSNDRLPLPDIFAEPPNDADYQAFYAELTATERGRNFLTEYARRSRHPDTHMLVSTIGRLDAAMRDDPPREVTAAFTRGLADLAAAIEQVAAVLAASESTAADGLFAAERIQDIVLALRRHQVEAALCDALEAAIREVSDAIVGNNAAANRAASAAALLRDLARHVNDMIAVARAGPPAELRAAFGKQVTSDAGVTASDAKPPPDEYAEGAGSANDPPTGARAISAEILSRLPLSEEFPAEDLRSEVLSNGEVAGEESSDHGIIPAPEMPASDQAAQPDAEPPSMAAQQPASDEIRGDDNARRFDDTADESATDAVDTRLSADNRVDSLLLEPIPLSSSLPDAQAPANFDEDPHELFEPLPPVPSPLFTAQRNEIGPARGREAGAASYAFATEPPASAFAASPAMEAGMEAKPPLAAPSPHVNVSPPEPATSRATPSDPLAAVLALSEEELIALFS
jgi:hypothetical protein